MREGELELVARLAALYAVYPSCPIGLLRDWLRDVDMGARELSLASMYSLAQAREVLVGLREAWENAEASVANELL